MYTIAHISDVHLGPLPQLSPRELFSKRITGFLNWHRNRRKHLAKGTLENLLLAIADERPDHLAVTGDFVNLATTKEIHIAADWLKSVGPAHEVSLVPGNHDAYVGGAYAKIAKAWGDYMQGDDHVGRASGAADLPLYQASRPGGAHRLLICRALATVSGNRRIREETGPQDRRSPSPSWRGRLVPDRDDPPPACAQCRRPPQAPSRHPPVQGGNRHGRVRACTCTAILISTP